VALVNCSVVGANDAMLETATQNAAICLLLLAGHIVERKQVVARALGSGGRGLGSGEHLSGVEGEAGDFRCLVRCCHG